MVKEVDVETESGPRLVGGGNTDVEEGNISFESESKSASESVLRFEGTVTDDDDDGTRWVRLEKKLDMREGSEVETLVLALALALASCYYR